jgi:UPF0042 nucleotide-binding protein
LRLLIISGLSGSGKSSALHMLEDLDYYCVDNIPSTLFETLVAELRGSDDPKFEHCAIGFDARPDPEDIVRVSALVPSIRESNVQCEVLFLTSSADVLLKRYSETRRKHPFSGQGLSLADSIGIESKLLAPLCEIAGWPAGRGATWRSSSSRSGSSTVCPLTPTSSSTHGRCPIPTGYPICAN